MAAIPQLEAAPRRSAVHVSVTARVYRRLLTDVMLGEIAPGRHLPLHGLARRYATSSASVRQALLQLTAEGLIETQPAQGFRAAPATADDFLDLIRASDWLLGLGMRESIANGDDHWQASVLAAHRSFAQSIQGTGLARRDELLLAGERFLEYRDALIGACRSHNLLQFCRSLNRRVLRYRNLAGVAKPDEREWAQRIRNAVLERQPAPALAALESYHRLLVERVLSSGSLTVGAAASETAGAGRNPLRR